MDKANDPTGIFLTTYLSGQQKTEITTRAYRYAAKQVRSGTIAPNLVNFYDEF